MSENKYIPVAIPYSNGKPHLGHALEAMFADALARYYRHEGHEVFFSMGLDEHGQKIARTAEAANVSPQDYVDAIAEDYEALWTQLSISHDDFIRTSQQRHIDGAQAFWRKAAQSGDIEKDVYEGLYCVGCEAYKTEKDLVDGKCPDHLIEPEHVQEENYFFRLSRYTERLLEWYAAHPDFVIPQSKQNEMHELLKNGLDDIPISRERSKMSWGIPVPDDDSHVMYVWFDALVNYLSVLGYGDEDGANTVAQWWPANVQIVGKDINRFHSILWPAMLMAAGMDVPHTVAVHGHIGVNGQKMSKSLGNVVDPAELVKTYGAEPVRYFFLRELAYDRDGDFSEERFREIYDAHLANGLGNQVSRVTNMIDKYFGGELDAQPREDGFGDAQRVAFVNGMNALAFDKATKAIWDIIADSDAYIEEHKPWELAKTDHEQLKTVLSHLLYALELISDWLVPILPETAAKITDAIGGDTITKAEPLFPRLEE